MEPLRQAILPFFFWIKAVHVISAAIWSFSTAVAFTNYVKPAIARWRRNPDDPEARARLREFMERFDRGVVLEHVAFVSLVATALLMIWIRDVGLLRWSFIPFKFWIGVLVILPMEALDVWLAHLGGNKRGLRNTADDARYEQVMGWHLLFLRVTEPLVIVLIPTFFVIAIVKPF
jgi:hypothetical protein